MNDDRPFRPFTHRRPSLWAVVLAVASLIGLIIFGYAVTVGITALALVWIGGFSLSLANVLGLALIWYIADVGIAQRVRSLQDQD